MIWLWCSWRECKALAQISAESNCEVCKIELDWIRSIKLSIFFQKVWFKFSSSILHSLSIDSLSREYKQSVSSLNSFYLLDKAQRKRNANEKEIMRELNWVQMHKRKIHLTVDVALLNWRPWEGKNKDVVPTTFNSFFYTSI